MQQNSDLHYLFVFSLISAFPNLLDSLLTNLWVIWYNILDQPVVKVNIKKASIFHILHIIPIRPIRSANNTNGV